MEMPETLFIKFRIVLGRFDIDDTEPCGPIFHRWLPNGLSDGMRIDLGTKGTNLQIYFERRGKIDESGFVEYAHKLLIDGEETIQRQGWLDAGPMLGILSLKEFSEADLTALQEKRQGSEEYKVLAKRILDLVTPFFKRLVDIFRTSYGQYWLEEIEPYNSIEHPLGTYCTNHLGMKWRLSETAEWETFQPKIIEIWANTPFAKDEDLKEYLEEHDWQVIKNKFSSKYSATLAHAFMMKALKAFDEEHFSQGMIQSVTALELAIEVYLNNAIDDNKSIKATFASFNNLPLASQASSVLLLSNRLEKEEIENVLKGISTRNKIVHEGYEPNSIDEKIKKSILSAISVLVNRERIKMPSSKSGNTLFPKTNTPP